MTKIAHEVRNKYTVHGKITALESAVSQLEAKLDALSVKLLAELQQYLDAHCHGLNGIDGAPGRDGVDGRSIVGPKGDRGDITVVGDAELHAAVVKLRAGKARAQAAFLQAISENSKRPHSGLKKMLAAVLNDLKRDAGF